MNGQCLILISQNSGIQFQPSDLFLGLQTILLSQFFIQGIGQHRRYIAMGIRWHNISRHSDRFNKHFSLSNQAKFQALLFGSGNGLTISRW
jgi:hypothetical protein